MKQAILNRLDLSDYDEMDLMKCLEDIINESEEHKSILSASHIAKYIKNRHDTWIKNHLASHPNIIYHLLINALPEIKIEMAKYILKELDPATFSLNQKFHLNRIMFNIEYIEYLESHPCNSNYLVNFPVELIQHVFQYLNDKERAYFYMSSLGLYRKRTFQFKKKQIKGTYFLRSDNVAISISRLLNNILNDHNFQPDDCTFIQSSMLDLVDFTSNDSARETLLRIYRTYPDLFFIDYKSSLNTIPIGFPRDILVKKSKYFDGILEPFIRNSRNSFIVLWNSEQSRATLLKAIFYTTSGLEDAISCGLNVYRHIENTDEYVGMALFNCLILENVELFFKLVNQFGIPILKIMELPKAWFDIEQSHEYRRSSSYKNQINAMFKCVLSYSLNLTFPIFSYLLRIVCLRQYDSILKDMLQMNVPSLYFRDLSYYLCGSSLEMKCVAINATNHLLQPEARDAEALVHALALWDHDFAKYMCDDVLVRQIIRRNAKSFLIRCSNEKLTLSRIRPSDGALFIFLKNESSRDDESEFELDWSTDEDHEQESDDDDEAP